MYTLEYWNTTLLWYNDTMIILIKTSAILKICRTWSEISFYLTFFVKFCQKAMTRCGKATKLLPFFLHSTAYTFVTCKPRSHRKCSLSKCRNVIDLTVFWKAGVYQWNRCDLWDIPWRTRWKCCIYIYTLYMYK